MLLNCALIRTHEYKIREGDLLHIHLPGKEKVCIYDMMTRIFLLLFRLERLLIRRIY